MHGGAWREAMCDCRGGQVEAVGFGLTAVLLGGVLQGSVLLPMKFTRKWQWENSWAGFSLVAYLLSPWVLAFLLVPRFPSMLLEIPIGILATTLVFGVGWGLGALTMGVGFRYLGMAITYAIVLGLASSVGTLIPLLVLTPDQAFTRRGVSVMLGVLVALAGTALVSWAARERDSERQKSKVQPGDRPSARNLILGLALCVSSGLLSSSGNLGLAFGSQLSQKAAELGAGPTGSASAVWSVILIPVFLCNFLYSLYLLRKNRTAPLFRARGTGHYWGLAALMGILWMGGMGAYGAGALGLGSLGTSMGFILFMSSMVITANVLGVLTGEWRGASHWTTCLMTAGIVVLLLAIVVVGMAGI
jgi:L-rhamnose-H+ transport protein